MNESETKATDLLQQLLRVQVASLVEGKNLAQAAPMLERLGIDRSVVADVFGTTPATVRAALSASSRARRSTMKAGERNGR